MSGSNTDGAWSQVNARLSEVVAVQVDDDGTRHYRFPDDEDGPVWLSAGALAQHLNYLFKSGSIAS